jgi:prepilin-type N-terminal cleavage/methylation domain-containing protein
MKRGFTLLEVLVAISILGLGLSVILSSQVGLFSSSQRAANLTFATNLARCKMNEVEIDLAKKGYPLVERHDEGPCCETRHKLSLFVEVERVGKPQNLDRWARWQSRPIRRPRCARRAGHAWPIGAGALGENPTGDLAAHRSLGSSAQGMAGIAMSFVYRPQADAEHSQSHGHRVVDGRRNRRLCVQQRTNPLKVVSSNAAKGLDALDGMPPTPGAHRDVRPPEDGGDDGVRSRASRWWRCWWPSPCWPR